jgi:hypothetical protein
MAEDPGCQIVTDDPRESIERVFNEYVFGFMESDISREIQMAKISENEKWLGPGHPPRPVGGGNLLAALGLLCYTEFLGSFISGKTRGHSRQNFEAFFRRLGPCYVAFAKPHDVYEQFRCGMVHEYAVKAACTIYMARGEETCGIGVAADGRYFFVVETYFDDFKRASRELYSELLKRPTLPR